MATRASIKKKIKTYNHQTIPYFKRWQKAEKQWDAASTPRAKVKAKRKSIALHKKFHKREYRLSVLEGQLKRAKE